MRRLVVEHSGQESITDDVVSGPPIFLRRVRQPDLTYARVPKSELRGLAVQYLAGNVFSLSDIPLSDRVDMSMEVFTPLAQLSDKDHQFMKEHHIAFFYEQRKLATGRVKGSSGEYPCFNSMKYLDDIDFQGLREIVAALQVFLQST